MCSVSHDRHILCERNRYSPDKRGAELLVNGEMLVLRVSPAWSVSGSDGNTGIALEQLDQGLRVLVGTVFVDHRLK
jgi:hypothetical protein